MNLILVLVMYQIRLSERNKYDDKEPSVCGSIFPDILCLHQSGL
jgi:hypothetical protein